eukprot:6456249-Amphidinium_carterae.1
MSAQQHTSSDYTFEGTKQDVKVKKDYKTRDNDTSRVDDMSKYHSWRGSSGGRLGVHRGQQGELIGLLAER